MNDATHEITSPLWAPGEVYLVNERNPCIIYGVLTDRRYGSAESWLEFYKDSTHVIIKDIVGIVENE